MTPYNVLYMHLNDHTQINSPETELIKAQIHLKVNFAKILALNTRKIIKKCKKLAT